MSVHNWNERKLVGQAQQRDSEAFNALIRIHGRNILNYLRQTWKVESSVKDAEDLYQETFAQAWRNIEMFREKTTEGPSSFGGWLFGIARNTVRSSLREIKGEELGLHKLHKVTTSEQGLPSNQVESQERDTIISSCIVKIASPYKEVLQLATGGYTDEEIARILGRQRATVRQQRNRGTKMLKEIAKRSPKR